jgi:hypothetical protein
MVTLIQQAEQSGTIASRPVWLPWGAASVVVSAILSDADVAAAGSVVSLAILWTFDAVRVGHAASCTWQSGLHRGPGESYGNSPPGLRMPVPPGVSGFAGQLIVPKSMNIGLSMDILDAGGNSLPLLTPSGAGVPVETPVYPVLR